MKKEIENWIMRISHTIPDEIVAVNIGLFESIDSYCLYITGSKHYEESNDDWACDIDFEPQEKYLNLISPEIKKLGHDRVLDYVIKIISEWLDSPTMLHNIFNSGMIVTVGFDDAPLLRIR